MWRFNSKLKNCARIMLVVILWNFLIASPVYANQPMEHTAISSEEETRFYSDSELDLLIDELSVIAKEAIEKAAAESAKAATLAALEREAAMIREVTIHQADAQFWKLQAQTNLLGITAAKKAGVKNAIIAGAVCLFGGLIIGAIAGNR